MTYITRAKEQKGNVIIFPELALTGYLPLDLINYSSFENQVNDALDILKNKVKNEFVILGAPSFENSFEGKKRIYNTAYLLHNGEIIAKGKKTLLPNYDVFHEKRYFARETQPNPINIFDKIIGLQVCEDMWDEHFTHDRKVTSILNRLGSEFFINISASPYSLGKHKDRLSVIKDHILENKKPFIYVNLIGGQDELVFDGHSLIVNDKGKLIVEMKSFEEDVFTISVDDLYSNDAILEKSPVKDFTQITDAIKLNLIDYIKKSRLSNQVILGLSGGIDSAITAYLAAEALGGDNVTGIIMPSKYTSQQSIDDAIKLAKNIGIKTKIIPINEPHEVFYSLFNKFDYDQSYLGIAEENLQPRIRALILMYISNKENSIVLSTGNKSEIAVGYTTLYGDSVGSKNLIGDLYKTQVYELARHINQANNIIPESIIDRPPTAELKPDQMDQDSLPEYEILDGILKLLIDKEMGTKYIIAQGFEKKVVEKVSGLVFRNEFKRAQMVQTVRISSKSFGIGRLYPTVHRFKP